MTAAQPAPSQAGDPHHLGHGGDVLDGGEARGGKGGPAPKRIITGYGFWIFLLSDIVMFSAFFAAYAVLQGQTAGGPGPRQLFDPRNAAIETACLLLSSFTCGLASLAASARYKLKFYAAMSVTFVLGLCFVALEAKEFAELAARGAGPGRSAFLSAFFTLVGCHGLHVTAGLLWLLTMMAQVFAKGFRADILRRILCFSLFWHALDIVWVALVTVVYLMGDHAMSEAADAQEEQSGDSAPGEERLDGSGVAQGARGYLIGLGLAALLTAMSFYFSRSNLIWEPAITFALIALAVAQMGVHLVFFLHITTSPDNTNNILALAFGVLIVLLVIGGSVWIMANLNHNMMPMDQMMHMQR